MLSGCISILAIEPVTAPPDYFLSDTSVAVEFLNPTQIGIRCAERGAKFFGLPGINSSACADTRLITVVDPCMTITAGEYAHSLCSARNTNAAPRSAQSRPAQGETHLANPQRISLKQEPFAAVAPKHAETVWRLEFVNPSLLETRCGARDLTLSGSPDGNQYCVAERTITLANPCHSPQQGWYERALCHELGHANGWPADHSMTAYAQPLPLARQSPEAIAFAARNGDASGAR